MKILFTLCGRAGSKGCKNKNIREFLGYPLFYYSINAIKKFCNKNKCDYLICVSTDSPHFINLVPNDEKIIIIERDSILAMDNTPKMSAIRDCANKAFDIYKFDYDFVVDFDITSPIRTLKDIETGLNTFISHEYDCVFSVTKARRNPYFNMVKFENGFYSKVLDSTYTSRQQAPKMYDMNASIYFYKKSFLLDANNYSPLQANFGIFEMLDTGVIDIDDEDDFNMMEVIAKYLIQDKKEYKEIFELDNSIINGA